MRVFLYIIIGLILASCTSNTIYKKPENLIPKDSMVLLLTDMYIASSAKNQKNKYLRREKNYMFLVYEKYKIDTTRFDASNTYYTSMVDEYSEILKSVKSNIDSLSVFYKEEEEHQDSIVNSKRLLEEIKKDSILKIKVPKELIEIEKNNKKI